MSRVSRCTDVVIIGNGPSAISLSFLLAGNQPFYNGNTHSNEYLTQRLNDIGQNTSLVTEDLEYLCEGLEGRSSNPVALLFDALMRPDADLGADNPPLVEWKYQEEQAIPHMVFGKGPAGGAWQNIDGNMQTLSLGNWMELPAVSLKAWHSRKYCNTELFNNRATVEDVRDYYSDYVKDQNLSQYFYDNHIVTSVQKIYQSGNRADCESGELEHCCMNCPFLWEVRGHRIIQTACNINEHLIEECETEEFCVVTPNVVIATGSFDIPNQLKISGEHLDHVVHSLQGLSQLIGQEQECSPNEETEIHDPVVLVGSGLSAADAILMLLAQNIPVLHVFRKDAKDQNMVLKKLPASIYPEYHRIHSLMSGATTHELYRPFPRHKLAEIREDMGVLIERINSNEVFTETVSAVAVLIGARPDLSFLPHGGKNLGMVPRQSIDSKHNTMDVDLHSYESLIEKGLFAMGPLVGDNFVRFGIGGALGITNHILKCRKKSSNL